LYGDAEPTCLVIFTFNSLVLDKLATLGHGHLGEHIDRRFSGVWACVYGVVAQIHHNFQIAGVGVNDASEVMRL
jgi:hypothetical protein